MNMIEVCEHFPLVDDILAQWRGALGADFGAYRNHCYRMLNYCLVQGAVDEVALSKLSIAGAFHDLGIWTHNTFDYLTPSRQLAREYLPGIKHESWAEEIEAMIEYHHKLTAYRASHSGLVEVFRKADWVDVSLGVIRFGLPVDFVAKVRASFPNAGFHRRLVALTLRRLGRHPFSPLPMMRW